MKRVFFALLPLCLLLLTIELIGRRLPDDPASLYDPRAPVLTEAGPGLVTFTSGRLRPQTWSATTDAFRIIVVGDSTVYGRFPDALATVVTVPGRSVEVLNFGLPGAASDRVRTLVRAALTQDPDLILVYVGHNEVLESRLNPASRRSLVARTLLYGFLRTGSGRLIERVAPRRGERSDGTQAWDGSPLQPDEWPAIAATYEENLRGMIADAGAASLRLIAPISSLAAPGQFPVGTPEVAMQQVVRGLQLLQEEDPDGARRIAERLLAQYPSAGPPLALRGLARLQMRQRAEGLADLLAARRQDGRPVRATEAHLAVLRAVASDTLIETEAPFLSDARYVDPRDPLFVDPVHPSEAGNLLLARVVAAQLGAAGIGAMP